MLGLVGRVVFNLWRLLTAPLWWLQRLATKPRGRWVHVRLRPRLAEIERPPPLFLRWLPGVDEARPTSLTTVRELADLAAEDPRVDGVVFDVPLLAAGWASCQSLRDILVGLRSRGRKVVVYLPQGAGNRELFVASAADRILAGPHTQLAPLGLAASFTYVKGLLAHAGLSVEVHRRAEYKTAAELATNDSMSEPQREQTQALLETIDRALRDGLASRPGIGPDGVDALFATALLDADQACEKGLVDGVCYEDELPRQLVGDGLIHRVVRAPRYYAWRSAKWLLPLTPRRFVAVVPIHGSITGTTPGIGASLKLASVVTTLRAVRQDPRVAGVVLHVDSPGGSALASDLIHREVERLRERKPVVACFGDVAASGGYYVSACADAVVAQPTTVTGSIGVVSARLVTEPLLDKLGVRVETMRRAPHADMLMRAGPLPVEEAAIVDREIDAFYRAFVGVVARGRKRPTDEIEALARGRVWSGADAHSRGLVDRLGGLDVAVDEVRKRVEGLSEKARRALRPRVTVVRRLEIPPAEPTMPQKAALALLRGVDPRLADLWELGRGDERVLCYAADLPKIV